MAEQPKPAAPQPAPAKPSANMGQRAIVWVVAFIVALVVWYVVDRYLAS